MPTISTSSPTLISPCSTRPVTTVPRPVIVNTSSIGMRNGLSSVAGRLRNVGVDRLHQLEDLRRPLRVALERLQRRDLDDRDVVAGELVLGEQLAHLQLDELEQLGVVDHVGLVERDDDRRHLDLAGEQDVLAGLRHRAVGRRDDEDRAVHLGGARDHVLDVVGVPRAVDVRVVAVGRLVLDVRGVDRDAALALLGRVVDRREVAHLVLPLPVSASTFVIAAVSVVLPWSICPIVPTLTCGFVRSNFCLAIISPVSPCSLASRCSPVLDDLARDRLRHFLVAVELHGEICAALRHRTQVGRVAEHLATAGRCALTTCALPSGLIDSIRPRRELRLPITSPR